MTTTRGSGHLTGPLLIAAAMVLTGTTGTTLALGPDGIDPTAVGSSARSTAASSDGNGGRLVGRLRCRADE